MDWTLAMTNHEKALWGELTVNDSVDEKLAVLALKDDKFFEILVDRYAVKLRRYVLRFINCEPQDAEDIVQDVFVNAYRNLNDFDSSLKFSSWLYRIAHNEAVNHLRRISARPVTALDDGNFEVIASELNIEKELGRKMDGARLRQALGRLDQKYRDPLILRYFEEKSYDEISDILRKPLGSVSSLITRAKRLLLKEVEGENQTP